MDSITYLLNVSKLEATFLTTHYPDVIQREMLAKRVQLKEERIEVGWMLAVCSAC